MNDVRHKPEVGIPRWRLDRWISGFRFGRTAFRLLALSCWTPETKGVSRWNFVTNSPTRWDIITSGLEAAILDFRLRFGCTASRRLSNYLIIEYLSGKCIPSCSRAVIISILSRVPGTHGYQLRASFMLPPVWGKMKQLFHFTPYGGAKWNFEGVYWNSNME